MALRSLIDRCHHLRLQVRFEQWGVLAHLDETIELRQAALTLDSPDRDRRVLDITRGQRYNSPAHLNDPLKN